MKSTRRALGAMLALVAFAGACGSDDDSADSDSSTAPAASDATDASEPPTDASDAPAETSGETEPAAETVKISVSNLPPTTEQGARDAFMVRVDEFEAANPSIDVEPNEYEWDIATFSAQLAGGTLPTAFQIPFTDVQGLIQNGQLADISGAVAELPYAGQFNPNVLAVAQDGDGNTYGLPIAAYGIGLNYNRALFEQAGLDPDSPPTTWDEVREAAKAIADATGQAGFAQMSQSNTGGWMLTTLTYALGGRMQTGSGDDVQATINNPGTKKGLEMLKAMRWEDNSMGSNFLFDWGGINQEFAAGKVGMYMGGSDVYNSLVTENNIDPATFGLTVLPLDGADSGVLGGGTVMAVRGDASPEEIAAAVKWVDFFYMSKLVDEESAKADAKALADSDAPVGTPALPIFSAEQLATSDAWVAEYVNVPLEQMRLFKDNIFEQALVPEPPAHTQEMYAILDAVVQAVLTDQDADIDGLLDDANADVTALLDG
jgi:multiple sugar transport system substrate-binding protein